MKRRTGPDRATVELVRGRDRGRCVRCGVYTPGGSIHHRQGRGGTDPHRPAALGLFCGSGTTGCHGYVHANPAEAYAKGWMVRRLGTAVCEGIPIRTYAGWVLFNADGTTTRVEVEDYADVIG